MLSGPKNDGLAGDKGQKRDKQRTGGKKQVEKAG